jgi:CDK inhibitor PHO81
MGLCLEFAICSAAEHADRSCSMAFVNTFTDSVLRTVYNTLGGAGRRRITMASFSPDICAALNWKQPNCKCIMCLVSKGILINHLM